MTTITTNLNRYSEEYANALPRLQAGLDNICREHKASFCAKVELQHGRTNAVVVVGYRSGALLRDVVSYLDEMQVLD